ncbi:MAG: DUF5330 domain-containing protein [Pseudomonadota bacterium]
MSTTAKHPNAVSPLRTGFRITMRLKRRTVLAALSAQASTGKSSMRDEILTNAPPNFRATWSPRSEKWVKSHTVISVQLLAFSRQNINAGRLAFAAVAASLKQALSFMKTIAKLLVLGVVAIAGFSAFNGEQPFATVLSAAINDARTFCDRQPEACRQGAQLVDRTEDLVAAAIHAIASPRLDEGTLTPADRALAPPTAAPEQQQPLAKSP